VIDITHDLVVKDQVPWVEDTSPNSLPKTSKVYKGSVAGWSFLFVTFPGGGDGTAVFGGSTVLHLHPKTIKVLVERFS
jgi:hypothetical protein